MVKCGNCGHEHRITNYGRRQAIDDVGTVVFTTVHEANCYGWKLLSARDRLLLRLGERR